MSIASCFSDDRCGRNSCRQSVSTNYSALRSSAVRNFSCVNKNEVGTGAKTFDCSLHCQQSCVIDVYLVDLLDFSEADGPTNRICLNLCSKFIALFGIENFLGVVETPELIVLRKNDRTSYDRASEWRHA